MRRLALLLAAAWTCQAQAGLFDDDEARRRIDEFRARTETRFDQQAKAQLDLAGQLQRQADEIASLRGLIETLTYELDQARKRQQDLYLDLDSRLRKLEAPAAAAPAAAGGAAEAVAGAAAPASPAAADPAAENKSYEDALGLFKGGRYREAALGFAGFVQKYPDSTLAPNAQFWLANAWYAQRNCYKAIENHSVVVTKYPQSPKAPDAMLAIASCQQEIGNTVGSRRTLENLVARYPSSPAAESAQQRLKKK